MKKIQLTFLLIVLSFLAFSQASPKTKIIEKSEITVVDKPMNISIDIEKNYEKIYYKNGFNGWKIVSEKGYVFTEGVDFKLILFGVKVGLLWFPSYQAYFSLRGYDKLKKGESIELHMETARWISNGITMSDGRCLIAFNMVNREARVYLDGLLTDFVFFKEQQIQYKTDAPIPMIIFKSETHKFIIQDIILNQCEFKDICFSEGHIQE